MVIYEQRVLHVPTLAPTTYGHSPSLGPLIIVAGLVVGVRWPREVRSPA